MGGANKKSAGVRHTHFVGIPVSAELEDAAAECRDYMQSVYGCRSGQGTPPHITVVPPFALPDGLEREAILSAASSALEECISLSVFPFQVEACGFGSFAERTLFIHIKDGDAWQKIHSVFCGVFAKEIPGSVKKGGRRFYPHLSIANRDIPSGAMDGALKHFAAMNLSESFCADSVAVYRRSATGGWVEWQRLER